MDKKGGLRILKFSLQAQKKGDYKWSIMLSLILGLMVLSLSLYFIFNELWSGDDSDRQVCRQSIQVRALLPEAEKVGVNFHSFKDDYPLKCKTMVKEIDAEDAEDAGKIIAESMAECWALYDNGDANAFPTATIGSKSVCVPCARIHLTNEAKMAIGSKGINIENALKDLRMESMGISYYDYLMNSGNKFPAFSIGGAVPFDLSGDGFEIGDINSSFFDKAVLINRANGAKIILPKVGNIILPKILFPEKGDLIINYGVYLSNANDLFGHNVPYLFYFQSSQGDPFEEVEKKNLFGISEELFGTKFCETWEGIPA